MYCLHFPSHFQTFIVAALPQNVQLEFKVNAKALKTGAGAAVSKVKGRGLRFLKKTHISDTVRQDIFISVKFRLMYFNKY